MKLYSVTHPGGGCDPESDNYTLFRERPEGDVREWEVEDDTVELFALCRATARCCGTGHLFVKLGTDKDALLTEATLYNLGTTGPYTDYDREQEALERGWEFDPPKAYLAMGPLEVLDREDKTVPPDDALLWNTTTSVSRTAWELGLDDDVFAEDENA